MLDSFGTFINKITEKRRFVNCWTGSEWKKKEGIGMDLFEYMSSTVKKESPLASRLRPRTVDEIVGQKHILNKDL